jgi:hypothetical protein
MKTHYLFGGAATLALVLSLAGSAHAQQQSPEESTPGKPCTVKSGSNQGKTGVTTVEDGTKNTWCEGGWGATSCTAEGGSPSQCEGTKTVSTLRPSGLTMADKQVLQSYAIAATSGGDALADWGTKNQAKVVSRTGRAVTLSVSGRTLVIDGDVKGLVAARIR